MPTEDPAAASPPDLTELAWDDRFVRTLPGDPSTAPGVRQVFGAAWSAVAPTPVADPRLLAWSSEVAAMLDIPADLVQSPAFAQAFAGNQVVQGMRPFAACYGGHQFGNWAGQLGDGRAMTLGEIVNGRGERFELQLKGAGPTPYSRGADGRAVLRSSIREFVCSEAMHHLGVPTTRALSLVSTGDAVLRDMFYDGNPRHEPGAIVCRVAPSFLRFGSFQIHAARRDLDTLRVLVEDTLATWFPQLGDPSSDDAKIGLVAEVARRTAEMIVHWQRVGFVHGVMNTDNMSILGLTIDYGPYGWLEGFDPHWTPNTTDAGGKRYRFGHQPQVGLWNLIRLAEAIFPLVGDIEPFKGAVAEYAKAYEPGHDAMMRAKLGLTQDRGEDDVALFEAVHKALMVVETDMTLFYRGLSALTLDGVDVSKLDNALLAAPLRPAVYLPDDMRPEHVAVVAEFLRAWAARVQSEGTPDADRRTAMDAVNPLYVPRNYLAQVVIDRAEAGDPAGITEWLDVLRHPYDHQPGQEQWAGKRPEWARHKPGCSMLSCSS